MNPKLAILKNLPWDEILETLDALAEAGWDKDAAIELVAQLLDDALPMDTWVPGPAGAALEAIDGPVLRAVLGLLWSLATNKKGRTARKALRIQKLQAMAAELAAAKA
jgi:hypothetical protein